MHFFQQEKQKLEALVEEKVRSVLGDRTTRENLEATIQQLRQELERKDSNGPKNWQELYDMLEEVQRDCNAAFQRVRMRRKSPRTVVEIPFSSDAHPVPEENELQDFLVGENWELSASGGDGRSSPLSLPILDQSLNELADTEALIRGL